MRQKEKLNLIDNIIQKALTTIFSKEFSSDERAGYLMGVLDAVSCIPDCDMSQTKELFRMAQNEAQNLQNES